MSRTIRGLILIAVGSVLYMGGRVMAGLPWPPADALCGPVLFASIVAVSLGLFLALDVVRPAEPTRPVPAPPPAEDVWPPAPATPHGEKKEP